MRWRQAASSSATRPARSKIADSEIRHVSDTALWVATFRGQEGQREDAAFDDPLASLLSGERGRAIARSIPRAAMVEWGMIIRTSAIDRLLNQALTAGIDTVLNLGAGLDTRPYRMTLPATLRWIELDFPNIVELKNAKLIEHQPVCELERVGMDLLDRRSRNKLLARYGMTSKNTLVITEGVLSYFSIHDAATLAEELAAIPSIRFWIQDFDTAGQRRLPRGWGAKLKAAPFLFKVKDWFGFFEKYGWRSSQVITNFEESQRIDRPYPLDFPFGLILRALPKAMSQKILSLSGAVLMQNVACTSGKPLNRSENRNTATSPTLTNSCAKVGKASLSIT
jgi:methyltransferase (TIGR00027 family)